MKISSASFAAGDMIPKKFTCDGPDASPKLNWTEPPAKTQSFALIMDDPDAPAGTWVHWVLFDLAAETRELAEGVARQEQVANGGGKGETILAKSATEDHVRRQGVRTGTSSSFTRWMQK